MRSEIWKAVCLRVSFESRCDTCRQLALCSVAAKVAAVGNTTVSNFCKKSHNNKIEFSLPQNPPLIKSLTGRNRGSESEWTAARVVESEGGETATCGLEKGIKPLGCGEGERKEFLGQFELDVQTYGLTSLRTVLDGCASRDLSLGMTFLDDESEYLSCGSRIDK